MFKITTNVKELGGRSFEFDRNNTVFGTNGSGKTALVNSILLGLTGAVSDEFWRAEVKDAKIALMGPTTGFTISIEEDGNIVADVVNEPGKKPKISSAVKYVNAYSEVATALSSPAKLLEWFGSKLAKKEYDELEVAKARVSAAKKEVPLILPVEGTDRADDIRSQLEVVKRAISLHAIAEADAELDRLLKMIKPHVLYRFTTGLVQAALKAGAVVEAEQAKVKDATQAVIDAIEKRLPEKLALASRMLESADRIGIDFDLSLPYILHNGERHYALCAAERVMVAYGLSMAMIQFPFVFVGPDVQWDPSYLSDFMARVERDDIEDRIVLIQLAGVKPRPRQVWTAIEL